MASGDAEDPDGKEAGRKAKPDGPAEGNVKKDLLMGWMKLFVA